MIVKAPLNSVAKIENIFFEKEQLEISFLKSFRDLQRPNQLEIRKLTVEQLRDLGFILLSREIEPLDSVLLPAYSITKITSLVFSLKLRIY